MNIKKKLLFLTSTILSVFAFLTIISLFDAPSEFFFGENGLFSPAKVYAAETSDELTLTLLGDETIYYTLGTEYQELGAMAYDPVDGDVSEKISITGSVNINKIGTYKLTYKITHNDKTVTKYRNVIISNLYDEYVYDYSSSYDNYDTWNKIITTSEGNYLAVGRNSYDSSYYYATVAMYDSNFNKLWVKILSPYSYCNEVLDVIELSSGEYVLSIYGGEVYSFSGNRYSNLYVLDNDGNIIARALGKDSDYRYLIKKNNTEFYWHGEGSTYYSLCSISDNGSITINSSKNAVDYFSSDSMSGFYADGSVYSLYSNRVKKMNVDSNSSKTSSKSYYKMIFDGNYIYAVGQNYVDKLDLDLKVLLSYEMKFGTSSSYFTLSNDSNYIYVRYNYKWHKLLKEDLSYAKTIEYVSGISSLNALFNDENYIYYGYYDSNHKAVIRSHKNEIIGFDDISVELNSELDYSSYLSCMSSELTWYIQDVDDSSVDTSKSGIYNVYYTVKKVTENGIKTIISDKKITVLPKTSIEEGAIYDSSVVLDVEGGDISINGVSYSKGDVYSIPGDSTMVISGENGYTKTINFTIESHITGIEDNKTYYEPIYPEITGGYLFYDGVLVDSGDELSTKGYHNVTYSNSNTYVEVTYATIDNTGWIIDSNGYLSLKNSTTIKDYSIQIKKSGTLYFYFDTNYSYLYVLKNGSDYKSWDYNYDTSYSMPVTAGDIVTFRAYNNGVSTYYYTRIKKLYIGSSSSYSILNNNVWAESYSITIEPTIVGVEDGQTYSTTITPNINAENMTLNGVPYNNEPITNCGNYKLVITGTNGYTKTINFVIDTVITGVEDGGIYEGNVTPTFTKGTATLNGEAYSSGTEITSPGNHTLIIKGEDGYTVTINFIVNLVTENLSSGSVYDGSVTPILSGGELTLNDNSYTSGTVIDIPGNYTLIVNGSNGFNKTYYFVVRPEELNVENNKTYYESLVPCVSNGTVTLDGETYVSGTLLNVSGEHVLKIIGEGGYYLNIKFTLATGANLVDGETYVNSIKLQFIGTATLDGIDVNAGDVVDAIGNHTLVLTDGTNIFTYNFMIEPDYSSLEGEINGPVAFEYENASSVTLDGNSYTSGTVIESIGSHTIIINGSNGYTKTINFIINPGLNIENNSRYEDEVEVIISGIYTSAFIDSQAYTSNTIINEIGKHTITINGELICTFYVVPTINNVEDGGIYFGSVKPEISNGNIKLNSQTYSDGTIISNPGVYKLEIIGANDYIETINFIVLPEDFEVMPNSYHSSSIVINSNVADMKIDGISYTSGTVYDLWGSHTLSFEYNGVSLEFDFYIIPRVNGVEEGGEYTSSVTITTEWANLTIDGNTYTSGNLFNIIGYHTLVLNDLNGYNFEVNFMISSVIEGVEEGEVYTSSVTPTVANGVLTLNGNSYTSGTTISKVGNYTLKLVGTNGYERIIHFTIKEVVSGIENSGVYKPGITVTSSYCTMLLNDSSYSSGTSIYNVGYYTLKITGEGNYSNIYEFEIEPEPYIYIYNYGSFALVDGKEYASYYNNSNTYHYIIASYVQSVKLNDATWGTGSSYKYYDFGNYTVVFYGINGYEKEYSFTKLPYITGVTDGTDYTSSSMSISCAYSQGLTLNGETYSTGSSFDKDGYYTFIAYGLNGYEKEITFNKKYTITGIEDGKTYSGNTSVSNPYVTWLLDGETYTSGSQIKRIGNHTISFVGVGGYEGSYDFTIAPYFSGITDGTEYKSNSGAKIQLMDSVNGGQLDNQYFDRIEIDGEEYENYTSYFSSGNHKLVVYGINGYEWSISFKITPVISNLTENYNGEAFVPSIIVGSNDYYLDYGNWNLNGDIYSSNSIGHSSSTSMTLTASIKCDVSFEYNVSSESGYDYLRVYKNGSSKLIQLSGTSNSYTLYSITLNAGEYLTFTYSKDGSAVSGDDKAYIKNLTISPKDGSMNQSAVYFTVDGEVYEAGTLINEVGYHTLIMHAANNFETVYNITITPTISGISNGGTYNGTVTPIINYATLLLDGEEYISGTEIVEVGNHVLTILGANGYSQELSFVVKPIISGISSTTYNYSITPIIDNAILTLDGENYISNTEITAIGNHTLVITGVNGYVHTTTYNFTITPSNISTYSGKTFVKSVTIDDMGDGIYKLDGIAYNFEEIVAIGKHTMEISGTNGYEYSFEFTITEDPIAHTKDGEVSFYNGLVCNEYIQFDIPNVKLKIDGVSYTNCSDYRKVGIHYLELEGTNGYKNKYTFTITELLSGFDSSNTKYDSFVVTCNNVSSMTLNGSTITNNYTVNEFGNYTLVINGTNGYSNAYLFSINFIMQNIEDGGEYTANVTPVINSTSIKLNSSYYTSGTTISTIGNNSLVVTGKGGATKEVSFVIHPDIKGIEDGGIYKGSVNVTIFGTITTLKLNTLSKTVSSNETALTINTVGNNVLSITGKNGYAKTINFVIEPVISIEDGAEFYGSVNYDINGSLNSITLNGSDISESGTITTIGNNILKLNGANNYTKTIYFTIHPLISGIEEGGKYKGSVYYSLIGTYEYMSLNNNSYDNNGTINSVGNNVLSITGVNAYKVTYNFVIDIDFTNEPTSKVLDEITPDLVGEATFSLNGNSYINGTKIDSIGDNELIVIGTNGYTKTFIITIDPSNVIPEGSEYTDVLNIYVPAGTYIDGVKVVRDSNGEITYTKIGNHKMTIKGSNGYSMDINFVIHSSGISNEFTGSCSFDIDATMKIDDVKYVSGNTYYTAGNHVLTVVGTNGYEQEFEFVLNAVVDGINEESLYDVSAKFKSNNGSILIDGKTYENSSIYNLIGNHTLVINGTGDYKYVYDFTILDALETVIEKDAIFSNEYTINTLNKANKILVDGNEVNNGYVIDTLGNHTIRITGSNDYLKEYKLSIEPTITKIEDEGEYKNSASWSIVGNATVTLDGEEVKLTDSTNKVGYHTLVISTDYDYSKEISFTVLPIINGIKADGEYISSISISCPNAVLTIDDEDYTSGITYNIVGKHTFMLTGTNGYVESISFTLVEGNIGVVNDTHYDSVNIQNLNNVEQVVLDNTILSTEQKEMLNVKTAGKHTLVLNGSNGYTKTYVFYIDIKQANISNDMTYKPGQSFKVDGAKTIILNGQKVESLENVTSVGNNVLRLEGENDYVVEQKFTIESGYSFASSYNNRVEIKKIDAIVKVDNKQINFSNGSYYIEGHGSHTITVEGVNGYVETYTFTIENQNISYMIIGNVLAGVALAGVIFFMIRRRRVI